MSRYFGFVDGEAHDFRFKKHNFDNWTLFYLGEHLIGTLFRHEYKPGWGVIVHDLEPTGTAPTKVEGFVSRHAAIDYALMAHPKTRDTYNQDRLIALDLEKRVQEYEAKRAREEKK